MKTFDEMIDFILDRIEKGYANVIQDNGGETNWGISLKAHPDLKGRIKNLTRDEAKEIYWKDYYLKSKINEFPEKMRLMMLDGAINIGVNENIELVQEAINSLSPHRKLDVDGKLGPATLFAIRNVDPLVFLPAYSIIRLEFYRSLDDWRWAKRSWQTRLFLTSLAS